MESNHSWVLDMIMIITGLMKICWVNKTIAFNKIYFEWYFCCDFLWTMRGFTSHILNRNMYITQKNSFKIRMTNRMYVGCIRKICHWFQFHARINSLFKNLQNSFLLLPHSDTNTTNIDSIYTPICCICIYRIFGWNHFWPIILSKLENRILNQFLFSI